MAKPDLQQVRMDPSTSEMRRLDGKLGLSADTRFQLLPDATDDVGATAAGVAIGGLYRTGSVLKVRRPEEDGDDDGGFGDGGGAPV